MIYIAQNELDLRPWLGRVEYEEVNIPRFCRDMKRIAKFNEVYISRLLSNTTDDRWKAISNRS